MVRREVISVVVVLAAVLLPGDVAAARAPVDAKPGEVIVAFSQAVSGHERAKLRRAQDSPVEAATPALPGVQLLSLPPGRSVEAAVKAFERSPLVRFAQPNYRVRAELTPNDTHFSSQWGLHNTGQTPPYVWDYQQQPVNAGTADADIDAPEAWDRTTGSSNVAVGVVDSGVNYEHPDLAANAWTNPGESGGGRESNGIDDDGNGYVDDVRGWDFASNDNDPFDDNVRSLPGASVGHGTHVAGIAGAVADNAYGTSGVSRHVRLMPTRVFNEFGHGDVYSVAAAMAYSADSGARVVNLSLSYQEDYFFLMNEVVSQNPGVLFVAAAGNQSNGIDGETLPTLPCMLPQDNLICVAATDQNDLKAHFSNWGTTSVDLGAPGVDILSMLAKEIVWLDSFDTPIAGRWTTGGTNNTWASNDQLPDRALSDSPAGNYLNNTDSWVERGADLTGKSLCKFRYAGIWNLADDKVRIEISDGGAPPSYALELTGSGGWQDEIDLAAFENRPDVRFRIRLISNSSTTADGIHLVYLGVECRRGSSFGPQSFLYLNGTSMAAPMVAGAAALLWGHRPAASSVQIRHALLDSVDPKPQMNLTASGGRLNVNRAIDSLYAALTKGWIVVRQETVGSDDQDFSFNAGGGLSPSSFVLDDFGNRAPSNTRTFGNLTPGGGYSVAQALPAGWYLGKASCDDGSPINNISVSGGETVTCKFTNARIYARPGSATPLRVPLVNAYEECSGAEANSMHVAPLELWTCVPTALESEQVTTGKSGQGSGFARFNAIVGNPGTAADEADITIGAYASDVRRAVNGADYTGGLTLATQLRITDRGNDEDGVGSGTVSDFELAAPMTCAATPGSPAGSTCSTSTTADALLPNFAKEGRRAILAAVEISVKDEDGRRFLGQGVFVP